MVFSESERSYESELHLTIKPGKETSNTEVWSERKQSPRGRVKEHQDIREVKKEVELVNGIRTERNEFDK